MFERGWGESPIEQIVKDLINTVAEATDGKYEANRLQGPGTDGNPSGLWIREKDENGEYTGDYIPFEDSPDAENIKPYPPDVKVQSVGQYLMSKVNKTPVKTKSTPPPAFDDLPDEALNRRGRKMRAKRNKQKRIK